MLQLYLFLKLGWIVLSLSDGEIHIDSYIVLQKDRNRQGGGGGEFADLASSLREDLPTVEDEALVSKTLLPRTKPIFVGTIYRPPKQAQFIENLESLLCKFRSD